MQQTENVPPGQYILDLLRKGKKKDQIEAALRELGHEEYFVKQIVAETIKLKYAKARSQGLMLILAGGLVCFFSCVLTLGHAFSDDSFPILLYGLTSLGILLVFAGFVRIF